MTMLFEGEFRVPGRPDEVIRRFTDIARMARCMPGASIEGRDEEGHYLGVMTVAFGPKRIRFKGRMTCDFDLAARTGLLKGRGAADARAARVAVETAFRVEEDEASAPDYPVSRVRLDSKAELGGVIADFARTGGTALANVLMSQFAQNLAEELSQDAADGPQADAQALSARKLLWSAVKAKLA